jgi:hypothetical protein
MTDPDETPATPAFPQRELCSVPATRLGERGDINRAYSADLIATNDRVRKPFQYLGELWVCTSITGWGLTRSGCTVYAAYRLTPERMFIGVPMTYHARTGTAETAEAARNDPFGFYHGMAVKHGSEAFVLLGPPVGFIGPSRPEPEPPEPMQLTLF